MYFWLKVLHIGAMAVWFTGLFFLPRLFVVQQRGEIDADRAYFNPAANLLFFRIMTPAALITTVLGMVLMAWNPDGAWLVMKLVLVTVAVLVHLYLGVLLYRLGQGHHRPGPWLYRALGWTPLVLLLAIAALTGAKPDTVGDLPPPPSRASLTPPGGQAAVRPRSGFPLECRDPCAACGSCRWSARVCRSALHIPGWVGRSTAPDPSRSGHLVPCGT